MKFADAVIYVGNKYPQFDVKMISTMASEIFDAYTDGTIAGRTERMEEELAWLNEDFQPTSVTVHSNREE